MFTTSDRKWMSELQNTHMNDRCEILRKVKIGTDPYNLPENSLQVITTNQICGLNTKASREMLNAEYHQYDATLRLPLGVDIRYDDQIRIIERFGSPLADPISYSVLGKPIEGPSGLRIELRSLTQ